MDTKKELQNKLGKYFKEYTDTLRDDEDSLEEYYNTPKGYAIKEIKNIFTYLGFEIPQWMVDYYVDEIEVKPHKKIVSDEGI